MKYNSVTWEIMRSLIFNDVTSTTILETGDGIYNMSAGFSYIHPKDILHNASLHEAILSCNCLNIKGGGNFVAL